VDSTLLVKVAKDVLGDNVSGVVVQSPTLPDWELHQAREIASDLDFPLIEMVSQEMELPEFIANTPNRCYFCKDHRFAALKEYAAENNFQTILDGSNADDISDHRPGQQAATEHGVRSPLQEVELSKKEIRNLAKQMNLPNWNKPSSACLASRIPYGTQITLEKLNQIKEAEEFLYSLGLHEFRVRHHGDIARIEVPVDTFELILSSRETINQALKEFGFSYVTLDIKGFRSGSMNEVI
jgi:uncharacterized protein